MFAGLPVLFMCAGSGFGAVPNAVSIPDLPDREIVSAYEQAGVRNVLAAVNDAVFPGYWSVCADGQGFGFGNTYPSLDGHQMADALLWLGQTGTVRANWDYVRGFQRPNGRLPLAILPSMAGKAVGDGEGLLALIRIRRSQRQKSGIAIAIAGIIRGSLALVFLLRKHIGSFTVHT